MIFRRVEGYKDYLLKRLWRRYISLSFYRSLYILLNINKIFIIKIEPIF